MNWRDVSEIAVGHALRGKIDPNAINPIRVSPPYERILKLLRKGKNLTEVTQAVGLDMTATCMAASERANGFENIDYLKMLEQSAAMHDSAGRLTRITGKLERGEEVDPADLLSIAARLENSESTLVRLSEVEATKVAFQPTYWKPLDKYMGGVPVAALTVIAGPPGIGKTGMIAKMAVAAALKRKTVVMFEFEMRRGELLMRMTQIANPSQKTLGKIIVVDTPMDVHECYAKAVEVAAQEDVYCFFVDSAMMLVDEEDYVAISKMYRQLDILARKTNIPVVLVAQLNSNYVGGIPKINHIRGSRLAEYHARLILLIWNPEQVWADVGRDARLEPIPGAGYVIVGKSTYGFGDQHSVGAIAIPFNGKEAWGDEPINWFPLAGGAD